MRGANGYEPLDQTHQQVAAGQEPTTAPDQAEIARSIDNVEERRAALDQELARLREPGRASEQQEPGIDRQAEIDRALALQPDGQSMPEQKSEAASLDDSVAPEQWTDRGGMVEQQTSAMEWLEHSDDVRRERAAAQEYHAAAHELTAEDQQLLEAARTTEAQTQQQEMGQSQVHEPSGP
jgi:hypothetical protein